MPVKCFYHTDLDGYASGAIVKLLCSETELFPINYGFTFPWDRINKRDIVHMVDFCLQPFSDMIRLKDSCQELVWIDHHKTALELEGDYSEEFKAVPGFRVDGIAACQLTWMYCFPSDELPVAVKLLGEYDIWDHSNPTTLPFQYGMQLKGMDPREDRNLEIWKTLLIDGDSVMVNEIINSGTTVLCYENQHNASYVKSYSFDTVLKISDTESYKAIVVNRGNTGSKIFDTVWDANKYDLMLTFVRLASKRWTVSLYSTKPQIDCGAIAKKFGGGGHRGAAGFQCDNLPFEI